MRLVQEEQISRDAEGVGPFEETPGRPSSVVDFHTGVCFTQDISPWDVSQVTVMKFTFYGCSAFKANLSGWNTIAVEDATNFSQLASSWECHRHPRFPPHCPHKSMFTHIGVVHSY